jgi:uncharacterized RDD family membrane protein YckC
MKCPKCGYLGFEDVQRCRNCGYDFSLSSTTHIPDLPIRSTLAEPQPLVDLTLLDKALAPPLAPAGRTSATEVAGARSAGTSGELPLFQSSAADDVPLITKPSPPRTPLAVRRSTPDVPRLRTEQRTPMLDLGVQAEPIRPSATSISVDPTTAPASAPATAEPAASAAIVARALAMAIDLVLLAGLDLAVVYLTMQICGLTATDIGLLPKRPLIAFLVLQNVSYFVVFTAGGQTLGQMMMGIKVVSEESSASPDLRHALIRTLVWIALTVPAGLGLLTALFSRDHRGLHDRCAGTRVVRAGA